jgi:hypothetical protein
MKRSIAIALFAAVPTLNLNLSTHQDYCPPEQPKYYDGECHECPKGYDIDYDNSDETSITCKKVSVTSQSYTVADGCTKNKPFYYDGDCHRCPEGLD